jgi:hypothetical protein
MIKQGLKQVKVSENDSDNDETTIIYTKKQLEKLLNEQQKHFCHEILFNNRVKAYMGAYPDCEYKSASASATRLLEDVRINQYVAFLKLNIEELTGVSKIRNVQELAKIAYISFEELYNDWIELSKWDDIRTNNPSLLSAIESIDTKTEKRTIKGEHDIETDIEIKYVKLKFHSKTTAIAEINKMMGYNSPEKVDLSNTDGSLNNLSSLSTEELIKRAEALRIIEENSKK